MSDLAVASCIGPRVAHGASRERNYGAGSYFPATCSHLRGQKQVFEVPSRVHKAHGSCLEARTQFTHHAYLSLLPRSVYMTLSYVASSLAPLELAAHQLVYSMWSLCSFATVPLEQVALAFVPAARGASLRCGQTPTASCRTICCFMQTTCLPAACHLACCCLVVAERVIAG